MGLLNDLVLSLALLPSLVFAHGHIEVVIADGVAYPGFNDTDYDNPPPTVGWITQEHYVVDWTVTSDHVAHPDIICHKEAKPAQLYVTAKPGEQITFEYNNWPYGSHPGPALDYVASCNGDCTTVDKTTLKWLKFAQKGYDAKQQQWATDAMLANRLKMSITIPNWKPGNYVIRHELINLYLARLNKTEMYPNCVNFKIEGSGTEDVAGGVIGTELYKATDPGLLMPQNPEAYQFPGPQLANFTYP